MIVGFLLHADKIRIYLNPRHVVAIRSPKSPQSAGEACYVDMINGETFVLAHSAQHVITQIELGR